MKRLLIPAILIGAAILGWNTGGNLDSDAMGMIVGIVLGVIAAIPTALILLAASPSRATTGRRGQPRTRGYQQMSHAPSGYAHSHHAQENWGAPQPPVIVLAGAGMGPNGQPQLQAGHMGAGHMGAMDGWGQPRPARRFKLVGEQEGWIDE